MTARPRRDVLDGTVTDPDRAVRVMVTDARQLTDPATANPSPVTGELAALVLWMDMHLSNGGALPTQWAIDGTIADHNDRPVETVQLPAPTVPTVEVVYQESWRADYGDPDIPSREGWQVRCTEHGLLQDGYAYAGQSRAEAQATRHRNKHPAPAMGHAEQAAAWLAANRAELIRALADAAEYRDPQGECVDDLSIPGTGERLCDDHAEDGQFITVYDRLRAELEAMP